jgi:integrase
MTHSEFPFKQLLKSGGIDGQVRCAESGMDRHTLAKLMGHSSPRIAEKYYIHVTEPHVSSGFERFMAYQAKRLGVRHSMMSAR